MNFLTLREMEKQPSVFNSMESSADFYQFVSDENYSERSFFYKDENGRIEEHYETYRECMLNEIIKSDPTQMNEEINQCVFEECLRFRDRDEIVPIGLFLVKYKERVPIKVIRIYLDFLTLEIKDNSERIKFDEEYGDNEDKTSIFGFLTLKQQYDLAEQYEDILSELQKVID